MQFNKQLLTEAPKYINDIQFEVFNETVLLEKIHEKTGERVSTGQQVQRESVKAPSGWLSQVSLGDTVVAQV